MTPNIHSESFPSIVPLAEGGGTGHTPAESAGPQQQLAAGREAANYDISLQVDHVTHELTAVVKDRTTQEVIQEIPAAEMRTASNVIRNLIGPLLDKKA